jgi:hypothetical protein
MGIFLFYFSVPLRKIVCLPMEEEEIFVKFFCFKKE